MSCEGGRESIDREGGFDLEVRAPGRRAELGLGLEGGEVVDPDGPVNLITNRNHTLICRFVCSGDVRRVVVLKVDGK